ncbi:peptide chain release factor N(5)-glutamine methyltransferase [Seleniivibrio woodruffii]|uniref:peptide chain release factor N(5)-glutamine methyltransferase n=1 Tax=Seleniivibrio woodruffii TaxID=1078050 RepID=A0A4R1KEK9_9BACT|nr:peptide chain release factor N(5)-glutamine methyltransferase [Seleniivibrio woodruffii]TCK62433.1 release factor glutamine methyltransferase [Seleniivibrio woodruffii]TVZ34449.1 release factor glutamine methyltransferase [Seleniivibrio woodruffii]
MKLAEFIGFVRENYLPNRHDALELASKAFDIEYSKVPLHLSDDVTVSEDVQKMLDRLGEGEPLAYVINNKSFYGLDMYVDGRVLIPRPETELIVSEALRHFKGCRSLKILDVCTGSGCIPAAILHEMPDWTADVLDISADALAVADINLNRYAAGRYRLIQGDALRLTEYVCEKYDIITCNPPYLTEEEWEASPKSLKYEPKNALSDGGDGLLFYKKLLDMIPDLCHINGVALFELGQGQHESAAVLLKQNNYKKIKDYQGIERVLAWTNL